MSTPTILDRVRRVVGEIMEIPPTCLHRDDRLSELGFDALDWLSLDLDLEREFGAGLTVEDLDTLEQHAATIGALALAVERRLNGGEADA